MLRGVRRTRAVLVLLYALAYARATAIASPPQVEIRAQTKLVLDKIRLISDDHAELRGHLVDAITGDGIAGQHVHIHLGDADTSATTERDGGFHVTVPIEAGKQEGNLKFTGNQLLGQAELSQPTDPSRAQVSLTLDFEEAAGGIDVIVHATADDQAIQLPIALAPARVTTARGAPPLWTRRGSVVPDKPFLLSRQAAGGPGTRRVRAEF